MNRSENEPLAKKMASYNTQKEHLIIREYGRNTQNLINHAKTIEDRAERQKYVERIVHMIMSMHPHTRNLDDYRLKVWSHVLQMADYDLDVDIPDNLPDARARKKPDKVHYPKKIRKLRHYGKNVKTMIDKAKVMENQEHKDAYIGIIGAYMKMSYRTWNRENVNDEVIFQEFKRIAQDELEIPEGMNIDSLIAPKKKKTGSNSSSHRSKSNQGKGNNKKKSGHPKAKNSKNNRNNNNNKSNRNYKKR